MSRIGANHSASSPNGSANENPVRVAGTGFGILRGVGTSLYGRWALGALFLVVVAGLAIGCYARFAGLGHWPLATDEFYFATAVDLWRAKGLPEFFSGNIYPRGLIVQFLATNSVSLFGETEFAYRLPAGNRSRPAAQVRPRVGTEAVGRRHSRVALG